MSKRPKGKNWYNQNAKKPRRGFCLGPGQSGFLITCNFREREAIREAYVLLNEYADTLFGPENKALEVSQNHEEEEDIEDSLDAEREALKQQAEKKEDKRRFQVVETSVKNYLFIRTTVPDPVKIVKKILDDIEATGIQRVRHLLRMVPIEKTCKAFEKPIEEMLRSVMQPHFTDPTSDPSFVVIFKAHCHNTIKKEDVIKIVGNIIKEMKPDAKVDYKNPDLSIIVDVIKDTACCGVVPRFYHYRKYNLGEVAIAANQRKQAEVDNGAKEVDENLKTKTEKDEEAEVKLENDENTEVKAENEENAEVKPENEEKADVKTENEEKAEVKPENEEKAEVKPENEEKAEVKTENEEKAEVKTEKDVTTEAGNISKTEDSDTAENGDKIATNTDSQEDKN